MGCLHGDLGFAGEESAGASFLRRDGTVWTTDKDGIIAALLAAKITAKMKKDPGEIYRDLTQELGDPLYDRTEAPATIQQKAALEKLTNESIQAPDLAGEKILTILTKAPGDGKPSAASRSLRRVAGSRLVLPALKISTRSMPKASGARIISHTSRKRPGHRWQALTDDGLCTVAIQQRVRNPLSDQRTVTRSGCGRFRESKRWPSWR